MFNQEYHTYQYAIFSSDPKIGCRIDTDLFCIASDREHKVFLAPEDHQIISKMGHGVAPENRARISWYSRHQNL